MRKGKLTLAIILALALSLALASAALARPMGCGMMGGMNLTPEQAGQLFDLKQKFMNDTASLRKQMWVKRAEMAALWRADNPEQAKIQAKQKELNAIREQMQEKMVAFRLEAKKIAPQAVMGMGPGMGMGGCGMGPGKGNGPGGGYCMLPGGPANPGGAAK